ncbi:MAG: hypothetical protein H0X72_21120 [Acidobacteria bacterium]|jgi:hypothetical protein|nr:hypothetical protein [Acidobacteriota bacterium]
MKNPNNAHIKLTIIPNTTTPNEITNGEIWFSHSQSGGGTFTLTAKITDSNDYEKELYTQTQEYSPHAVHQLTFNFLSPEIPGLYKVIAAVSAADEELESYEANLLVRVE